MTKYVYCKCGAYGLTDDSSSDSECPECEERNQLDADATIRDNDQLAEFTEPERSEQ